MKKLMTIALATVIGMTLGQGLTVSKAIQEEKKEVVAYQVAPDGETQVTYADGTDETYFAMDSQVAPDGEMQVTYENGVDATYQEVNGLYEVDEEKTDIDTPVTVEKEKNELYDRYISWAEVQEDGDWVLYMVDGSSVLVDHEEKQYLLYTKELGDWYLALDSEEELKMAIATYIECSGDFE